MSQRCNLSKVKMKLETPETCLPHNPCTHLHLSLLTHPSACPCHMARSLMQRRCQSMKDTCPADNQCTPTLQPMQRIYPCRKTRSRLHCHCQSWPETCLPHNPRTMPCRSRPQRTHTCPCRTARSLMQRCCRLNPETCPADNHCRQTPLPTQQICPFRKPRSHPHCRCQWCLRTCRRRT